MKKIKPKDYWLIAGGIGIGYGLKALLSEDKKSSTDGLFELIGGVSLMLIGIYGLRK